MNDDALKKLWQEQNFPSSPALTGEAQIAAMKTRMTCFDKTIQWRDYIEVAAGIFIILFFGWDLLFRNNSLLTQVGCVVLIASSIFIDWKLIASKRRLPKAEPNAPLFDAVKVELQKVENQIGLLKSVAWWYLLPLFVGVVLHMLGQGGSFPSKLGYFAFVLALYVFIYWLNQRAVKKTLLPLKRALESLLHSAETGEPLDQTHVANLRPIIALSMAAADQVKPVEFKVAFWQIAIFGVPGVVGIWFFLMLGLTMDDKDWQSKAQIPTTFAQSVHIEETNRYSVVARKVVDLLNAGDYAAVQKLYNPEMSKAFPPKETSDFYTRLAATFRQDRKVRRSDRRLSRMDRVPAALPARRMDDEPGAGRGRQNLWNLFPARAQAFREYQIVRPPTFQLAASGLARAFLSGRVVIFLADTENNRESRGDQHSGSSFVQRAKPYSLGRNKRSSAIQVSAHSKSSG